MSHSGRHRHHQDTTSLVLDLLEIICCSPKKQAKEEKEEKARAKTDHHKVKAAPQETAPASTYHEKDLLINADKEEVEEPTERSTCRIF